MFGSFKGSSHLLPEYADVAWLLDLDPELNYPRISNLDINPK